MGSLNSNRNITFALAILVVLALGERVSSFILAWREPFYYSRAYAIPDVLKPGDTLNAYYEFERYFYCNTDINRFFIDTKNNSVVWRERTIGGATTVGKAKVLNPIRLPMDMEPGDYILRTVTYSQCANGSHVSVTPDINFRIN